MTTLCHYYTIPERTIKIKNVEKDKLFHLLLKTYTM